MHNILAKEWHEAGVTEGDLLLVHSSIKRTIERYTVQGISISPADILESFRISVGEKGTLLLPLFNFDFTKGIPFDIRKSPSHMGALTEAGRKHSLAVRTGHPIYSFAAIGYEADKFRTVDNYSGYGIDSPFAMLREFDGRIAVLDLPDQNSMTFYHHVEEIHNVSYRYYKKFTGYYTNSNGETKMRTYGLFVRNLEEGILTHVNPAGELMWAEGLYKGNRPKTGSGLRTIKANLMFDFVSSIIISEKAEGLLYRRVGDNY
jgi:aminoglycoside 3-N-acetyltransferase